MEFYFKKRKGYSRGLFVLSLFIFLVVIFTFKPSLKNHQAGILNNDKFSFLKLQNDYQTYNMQGVSPTDFNNRIILFNIYDIHDLKYVFLLQFSDFLKRNYGNNITIIDIIYSKQSIANDYILNFILKNNIDRPVFIIPENVIENTFATKTFPSSFLVDPKGNIINSYYLDKIGYSTVFNDLEKLLDINKNIKNTKIKRELEKNKKPIFLVNSLSRLYAINNFNETNRDALVLLDSKGKKVFILNPAGEIIYQIGSGKNGNKDGKYSEASFCYPMGATHKNNILYVADLCNNSIREINLKDKTVSTLGIDFELKSPTDLVFLNDNEMFIATLDSMGPLLYNMNDKTLRILDLDEDGEDKGNIMKAHKYKNKVYYFNQSSGKILSLDKDGNKEVFFDLSKINEMNSNYKLESIGSFYLDDTGLYLTDKYSNNVFRILNNKLELYSGFISNPKNDLQKIKYNQPMDIMTMRDRMFITDENNKRIVEINKNDNTYSILPLLPSSILEATQEIEDQISEEFFKGSENIAYNKDIKIVFNLQNGWELEKKAPHYLRLFKEENKKAYLTKTYSKKEILSKNLHLPKLEKNSVYFIEGKFFYCNYNKKSPCLIKNYKKRIVASDEFKDILTIEFIY